MYINNGYMADLSPIRIFTNNCYAQLALISFVIYNN